MVYFINSYVIYYLQTIIYKLFSDGFQSLSDKLENK